jgi:hypothetical protein
MARGFLANVASASIKLLTIIVKNPFIAQHWGSASRNAEQKNLPKVPLVV